GCQIDGSTGRLKVDALVTPSGTPLVVTGDKTPTDAYANPTDHVGTWSLLGGFDGVAWRRLRTVGGSDNIANPAALEVQSFLNAYNRAGNSWGRIDRDDLTSVAAIA